ncbi:hypothetical protein [Pseudomonas amygdali]|uniref:hypothetical protein n=1 Tax=Pseudomonas amygdali TaxID=47877 RepID=UPI000AE2263B|nr:hypothetical protein [Pseudomonas amygdali]
MKTTKIIYALTLLAFSSLSHAEASLESESVIAAKNRIEELRVSMINSQVELDKLKSDLAVLRRAGDAEFFRIKLDKQETFNKDTLNVLPMIEDEELNFKTFNHYVAYRKPTEDTQLFTILIFSVCGFFLLGLTINKMKLGKTTENKEKVSL